MTEQSRPAAKLESVQILRALAASVVVAGHVIAASARFCAENGCHFQRWPIATGAGVDLFFVISGFIMVVASGRMFGARTGARDFMVRRLIRIVPLYWAVTTFSLLLTFIGGRHALPPLNAVLASYFFIPYDTTGRNDGFVFPIVDLGWTLNYEMMFYALFAIFISQCRGRCIILVTAALGAIIALGAAAEPTQAALRFWTQSISIEFVAGMWIAHLYLNGKLSLPTPVRALLAIGAIIFLAANPLTALHAPTTPNDFDRVLGWGAPAALLLVSAVAGPFPWRGWLERCFVLIGDASYSLYLTHPFWILLLTRSLNSLQLELSVWIFAGLAFLGSIAVAVVVHLVFERPVTALLIQHIWKFAEDRPRPATTGPRL